MNARRKKHIAWDSILVYLVTLSGMLIAGYVSLQKTGQPIELVIKPGNLIVGAFLTLIAVLQLELRFLDVAPAIPLDPEAKAIGKKKNLMNRLIQAGLAGIGPTALAN